MTGLSGSGKTTIAIELEKHLHSKGILIQILDGDNIRLGISNNLSFSSSDRDENIRRISELSKLFIDCGVVTLNCFVSPTIANRQIAKNIIGEENFIEVYINASAKTCEKRDLKGLYKKARMGKIKKFYRN
jgi:adenylylsulfate kinase